MPLRIPNHSSVRFREEYRHATALAVRDRMFRLTQSRPKPAAEMTEIPQCSSGYCAGIHVVSSGASRGGLTARSAARPRLGTIKSVSLEAHAQD
jgi:hypothetical protein